MSTRIRLLFLSIREQVGCGWWAGGPLRFSFPPWTMNKSITCSQGQIVSLWPLSWVIICALPAGSIDITLLLTANCISLEDLLAICRCLGKLVTYTGGYRGYINWWRKRIRGEHKLFFRVWLLSTVYECLSGWQFSQYQCTYGHCRCVSRRAGEQMCKIQTFSCV